MIEKMHHIGLCVTEMSKMVPFYENLLELKKISDFHMEGQFLDTVQGKEGMDYHIVKFASPDGFVIELLQDYGHHMPPQTENSLQQAGLRHFAFQVDDVDVFYEKVKNNGCPTISKPCTSEDGSMRLFFVRDPELNLVEIMQLY